MPHIDPIAMVFYAVVCAALAAFAPQRTGRVPRLALGAVVGLAAAALLPSLRGLLGI